MLKKSLCFVLLLFFSTLVASENQPSTLLKTSKAHFSIESSNDYIVALAQYRSGDFKQSYEMFNKLFSKYSDHVQINYYLAMSAVNLKLYDEASAAFQRVLIKKPEFHRARLEYARVMFILGFKQEAKQEFLKVASYPIPKNVRKNIERFLKKIKNSNQSNSTMIALSLGYMYDDNINSGIEYDSFTLPGFSNLEVDGEKPISSTSYFSLMQVNHFHGLSENYPISVKHTGTIFYKNQTKDDDYNMNFYSYKPTFYYNNAKNKEEYSLQIGVDSILPGDENDFTAYTLVPKYKKLINKDTVFSIYGQYKEIHYKKSSNETKDYMKKGLGTSLSYKKFRYKLSFEKDEKVRGERVDLDKDIITNSFYYNYDIQSDLFLNLQYQYKQIDYKDRNNLFGNIREDINRNIGVGLTKIFNKKDFLSLSYNNINNSSNQEAFDYKKESVMLQYTWRFKL
ncbi:MAG: tetratricopeptide repeat protein [Campylobacterota bacterium]